MNKIFKISFLLLAFVCLMSTAADAQKFGYLNSQAILADMPEVKEMQSNLEALQKQLQKQGQAMVADYKKQEQQAVEQKELGKLSPVDEQTLLENLQKKQEEILKFEKEMQQKLAEKEQKLLEPILERVNNAISDVAKENQMQMIFEQGVLLYADETQDVSNLVKAKLGI
ncbi:MAG: OmpH family outer membrane protein [Bacteroidota bacterium]